MLHDPLVRGLYAEICRIPLIDPHSHIDPRRPAARSLDDILGYHYYTELAHSAGMSKEPLAPNVEPRQRVRMLLMHMDRFDNTVQYGWFLEIARTFLGFEGERLSPSDCDWLCDQAERRMAQPDWEAQVLETSRLEKVFLTNDFDDPLDDFDTERYVPCLRTDDLIFHLDKPEVRQRLAKATGIEAGDAVSLRKAVTALFEHFTRHDARACAISLPPDFAPQPVSDAQLAAAWTALDQPHERALRSLGVFWMLAEHCQAFRLPFDLMIGVNRRVFEQGVYQGQDLFDQR